MMFQDSSQSIISSAKRFFSGTMISRLTGLGREIAMAAAFGTIPAVAAFWMAFRFAHLLRRLFGEGALNAAFIPHFESLRKNDPRKGARFFYDLYMGITSILLLSIILGECVLGGFLVFVPMTPSTSDVLRLTMVMLPSLVFIALYALNCALLNCERSYFLPSVAPAFLNLIWVGALAFLWDKTPIVALETLAMVIVFAFALQWGVTLPRVYRYLISALGDRFWQGEGFSKGELLRILRPFLLGMIGVAATQINSALDAIFARIADPEGPAYVWYAIRIQQLPMALFGVSLTGALLPPITRAIENKNWEKYRHFLNFALKKNMALMVPIIGGIFALGLSGLNLIYGHGEFSRAALLETTQCLWAYGVGLFSMTAVLIFAAAFYAQKNYRLPTIASALTVSLNIGLNALFVYVFGMGAVSIAIATTLTAFVNGGILAIVLYQKGELDLQGFFSAFVKVALCTLLAVCVTIAFGHTFFEDNTCNFLLGRPLFPFARHIAQQLFCFGGEALCFGGVLLGSAFLLRSREITQLLSTVK